jgi:hypothetical protein
VAEALLVIGVVFSALAVALCIVVIFRSRRSDSSIPVMLDQRLLSIEAAMSRSDAAIRDRIWSGSRRGP